MIKDVLGIILQAMQEQEKVQGLHVVLDKTIKKNLFQIYTYKCLIVKFIDNFLKKITNNESKS